MNIEIIKGEKIKLEPDDAILVKVKNAKQYKRSQIATLKELLQEKFPNNQIVVYDEDELEITIVHCVRRIVDE